jgi:hypothetical protein
MKRMLEGKSSLRKLSSIVTALMLLAVMAAYTNVLAPVAVNAATPILFNFDTGSPAPILRQSTPFDQTVGSMTAHFSSPQDPAAFAIQSQATTTFVLSQFSGQYLISNGGQRNTLYISFSQPINNITFTFATIDYHDPGVGGTASPISLTAYLDSATSTPVGSTTAHGAFTSDTYPEGRITLTTPGKTFNLVAVVVPFLQQGAVDFIVDSVMVYPASAIVDTTPPVSTLSIRGTSGSQGWWKSNIELTLSAQDASGVAKIEYSYNNAIWSTYTAPFNVTTEGSSNIYYRATDSVGNVEAAKTQAIKIDKTPPTGSIKINNGDASTTSSSVVLTLTQADAVSGVSQVRYSNDGVWDTEQWEAPTSTKAWTLTSGTGAKTVYYQVVDNAGLVSNTFSASITLGSAQSSIGLPPALTLLVAALGVGLAVAITLRKRA